MLLARSISDGGRAASLFPSHGLRQLVLRHRDACARQGLDARVLDEARDEQVLAWLRAAGRLLPPGLATDLERIDELTDEAGGALLLDVGADVGVDLRQLGRDPVTVAVAAFLDHPALFERAHGRRTVESLRGASEFAGRASAAPRAFHLDALRSLEAQLGAQFDRRGRSPHCRIACGRDGARWVFSVAHGALVRCDEALEDAPLPDGVLVAPTYLAERPIQYRPQRRDVVVYDQHDGALRVQAADAPTLHAYRRGFGELLHGDADWFGEGPVVSLEPLVERGPAIEAPTPGLREVRLVGLLVRYRVGRVGTIALDSDELWPFLAERLGGLADGELLEATFRVCRAGAARSALARVRVPNRVEYGRVEEEALRPWLEARGLLARSTARGPR